MYAAHAIARPLARLAGLLSVAALLLGTPLWAQRFQFHDLGTMGAGTQSAANGINNLGQILGSAEATPGGWWHPCLIDGPNQMLDMGYLTGVSGNAGPSQINDHGLVVGGCGAWPRRAFVASRTIPMTDLLPGASTALATSVNNLGQIAGGSGNSGNYYGWDNVFLKNPDGTCQFFTNILGESWWFGVQGLNDAGQMVGSAGTRAWLKLQGSPDFIDLGHLGGGEASAVAINNRGQIAGYSTPTGSSMKHLFLMNIGEPMRDLGSLGGHAGLCGPSGLNDRGQIVGYAEAGQGGPPHGVFVDADGFLEDLNEITQGIPPGIVLAYAVGINNAGYIVGRTDGTYVHAFLLVPNTCDLASGILSTIARLKLKKAVENSYLANLKKVCAFVASGKIQPAINEVNAFVGKVRNDIPAGQVPPEAGAYLISMAEDLKGQLTP